jgi:hypothetical protein
MFPSSGQTIRYAKSATGIAPSGKGAAVTHNIAGSAFQAPVVDEVHLPLLLRPGIATGGTCAYAPPMIALDTQPCIEHDVRLSIDIKACIVEDLIDIHIAHSALQAVNASAKRSRKLILSLTFDKKILGRLCFGVPSMR